MQRPSPERALPVIKHARLVRSTWNRISWRSPLVPVWLKTVSKEKEIKIKRKRMRIRKTRKLREIGILKNPIEQCLLAL